MNNQDYECNYDLRKLQLAELEIAKEIKRVCETNGIPYSIYYGSLIGAVRHHGFIPWDDDMDFIMKREDYDRFRTCCQSQLGDRFLLVDWFTDPYYGNGFLKIMLKGTLAQAKEEEYDKYPHGIFCDVFPYDNVAPSNWKKFFQKYICYLSARLAQQKTGRKVYRTKPRGRKLLYRAYYVLSHLFTRKFLINLCEREMRKYDGSPSDKCTVMVASYGYEKETIPASYFDEYTTLEFEGCEFSVIAQYDMALRTLYGDYMKLPPENERRAHGLLRLDFGEGN